MNTDARLNNHQIMKLIDRTIKEIWVKEIKNDINNMYILYEDTLKNALYYHLRKRLDTVLNDYNIRIFTEFHDGKLHNKGVKADIAIVKINDIECEHLKQKISKIYSIIELKYKRPNVPIDCFIEDVKKMMEYIKDEELEECQFYLGFIHEAKFDNKSISWLQSKEQEKLANGRLTELSACYYTGFDDMIYTILSYNNLNKDMNYRANKVGY